MSATKILWGQVITVFAIVLLAIWSATEWTAWRLGFQPELGHPWFELLHFPFYLPPAFFWWWYAYDAYAPGIFIEGAYIASSGGIIAAAVAIGMSVWRAREAKNAETYGSARWAQPKEIEAAGLQRTRWRRAGPLPAKLSSSRWAGACVVLRADAIRQGRRPGHPVASDLAWFGDRPRHQGRKLAAHRRLPRPAWPRAPVRSDQREVVGLQSAAGGSARRVGGARRPEHRRYPGRSRRQPRKAKSLGEDQPRAFGRRHPSRPLCRGGQDARGRRVVPVRSPSGRSNPHSRR